MTTSIRGGMAVVDARLERVDVFVADGRIIGIDSDAPPAGDDIDATGCYVLPGFVDVQLNGGWGVDFTTEPDRVAEVARRLPATGVTSFAPTVISCSPGQTRRAAAALAPVEVTTPNCARNLGVHLEGPFLNPQRRGAHPPEHLRTPDAAEAARWAAAAGIALVTLAPELDGAEEIIDHLVQAGVVVSAGHTAMTGGQLDRAVARGLAGATHLYNAMGPFSSRDPSTVGAVLSHPTLISGLIVDGIHVHPTMVDVAWRCLGPRQIALVTDAISAVGLGHGRFHVGDVQITVDDTGARVGRHVLAGSVLTMDQALRNLISFTGCSVAEASMAASTTPARLIGRKDIGSIRLGGRADLVILDGSLGVIATVIDGVLIEDL